MRTCFHVNALTGKPFGAALCGQCGVARKKKHQHMKWWREEVEEEGANIKGKQRERGKKPTCPVGLRGEQLENWVGFYAALLGGMGVRGGDVTHSRLGGVVRKTFNKNSFLLFPNPSASIEPLWRAVLVEDSSPSTKGDVLCLDLMAGECNIFKSWVTTERCGVRWVCSDRTSVPQKSTLLSLLKKNDGLFFNLGANGREPCVLHPCKSPVELDVSCIIFSPPYSSSDVPFWWAVGQRRDMVAVLLWDTWVVEYGSPPIRVAFWNRMKEMGRAAIVRTAARVNTRCGNACWYLVFKDRETRKRLIEKQYFCNK